MKKNINLIVFIREYPIGTDTKRTHHLLTPLLSNNITIKVLSFRSEKEIENEIGFFDGISYERIASELQIKATIFFKVIRYYLKGCRLIKKNKKKNSKNIVYCYNGLNIENLPFILFAKFFGFKIIFDIVEDYSLFSDNLKLISKFKIWTTNKLEKLCVKISDGVIVISNHLYKKYDKLNAKNLLLISITAQQRKDIKNRTSFNKPFIVTYAGSFADKDGVDFIVEGFKIFKQKFPDTVLYLIGAGTQQHIYKEKYKNEDGITFTGYLDDDGYYSIIAKADVLCMCRINSGFANAGFPYKLGEYLATGNPVIATKVSDVDTFLTDEDAYLIEPENLLQFTNALISIRNNPSEAFQKGLNGQKVCESSFSQEKNANLLHDLLIAI